MERELKVRGRARLKLRPDTVCADVTLEGTGKSCGEALSSAEEALGRVKRALSGAGFAEEALKSADFRVEARYENTHKENGEWGQVFVGYGYRHLLKIRFAADNEKLGAFAAALASSGADPLLSFSYTVGNTEAAREWLLREAVKDAAKKALVLADASGIVLKEISRIDYAPADSDFSVRPVRPMRLNGADTASLSFGADPDEVTLEDGVEVVWAF